jgi:hypothetical protein
MHFYSIQIRSSFLIQVSCMVYTIKTLEFKKLEWRFGCKTCIVIEDLIDFIEIHPIVAFEAIYEPMLTSFWSLISFVVQLYIIMQYKGQHPPLLPKMPFCLLYLPPKLVCIKCLDKREILWMNFIWT